jgi:hypothetical protein
LNFECQHPASVGLFNIKFQPSRVELDGPAAEVTLRILPEPPQTPPPPSGWASVSLARGIPSDCDSLFDEREIWIDSGELRTSTGQHGQRPAIPKSLTIRISTEHARYVNYVFEDDEGWTVTFDHGEFGGGVEWYAKSGGAPQSVIVGQEAGYHVPQNVNRAMVIDGGLFVLQGLSHLTLSVGQLAVIRREHENFTSRVIARFPSEPFDWILIPNGSLLVATRNAIWHVSKTGHVALFTRLPDVLEYPSALAQLS